MIVADVCATRELEDFSIPELPGGQNMVINIKTTWGDQHYVGLSGLEIFANTGKPVTVAKVFSDEFIRGLSCVEMWNGQLCWKSFVLFAVFKDVS